MKIQIVQVEIEEAIRQYVHSQIAVRDGHEISMKFTSTRGDDGLIADIDISPAAQPAPVVQTPSASVRRAVTRPVAVASSPEPAAEEPVGQAPDVAANATSPTNAPADDNDGADDDADATRPLRPSIFGNLRRPVNSDDANAEQPAA